MDLTLGLGDKVRRVVIVEGVVFTTIRGQKIAPAELYREDLVPLSVHRVEQITVECFIPSREDLDLQGGDPVW